MLKLINESKQAFSETKDRGSYIHKMLEFKFRSFFVINENGDADALSRATL